MKRRDFLFTAAGATGAAILPTAGCNVSSVETNAELMMLGSLVPFLLVGLHLDNVFSLASMNLKTRAISPLNILRGQQTLALLLVLLIRTRFLDQPQADKPAQPRNAESGAYRLYVTLRNTTLAVVDPVSMTVLAEIPLGQVPGQIAASEDAEILAITNNGSNSVSIVSTATNAVQRTITLDANSYPFGVAVLPDNRVYVVSEGFSRIYVLDSSAGTVLNRIELTQGASKLAVSPDGATAWAPTSSGNIHVIDTLSNTISKTLTSVANPVAVAFNSTGTRAYVTDAPANQAGSLVVLDATTLEILTRFPVGTMPYSITVSPSGTELYVANFESNTVTTIDLLANQVKDTLPTGTGPIELALLG